MSSEHQLDIDNGSSADLPRAPFTGNGRPGLRSPSYDSTAYMLILVVVLVPIIFTLILCVITYCIYRYNKNRSGRASANSSIGPFDRSGAPTATVIYNTQHSPFFFEESPPSYDSLANTKKDPHGTTTSNEQVQLTILPNTTMRHTNEEVTSAAGLILPSAPIPPPPSYINIDESNK